MAVREGFEPSIRVNVYTLSRRAPSATRTPHHLAQELLPPNWMRTLYQHPHKGKKNIYLMTKRFPKILILTVRTWTDQTSFFL